jgi:hypothetical protein
MTKEEIIAKVLGWDKFESGPLMATTEDLLEMLDLYGRAKWEEACLAAVVHYINREPNKPEFKP